MSYLYNEYLDDHIRNFRKGYDWLLEHKIISMDKTIEYIPVCTRRVFLKYYTDSDKNQLHFWGKADRKAYIQNMNEVLRPYLTINQKSINL